MFAVDLLSQKMEVSTSRLSVGTAAEFFSSSSDFYFPGRLFGEAPAAFGANLSIEEIADRYGLSE